MKLFLGLCLVVCFVGAHCKDFDSVLQHAISADPHIAECMAESKVDAKTFEDAQKAKKMPNTPEVQCYLACMMKKDGMMNADGTLTQKFNEDTRTDGCRNQGGKDACEIAFKIVECLVKADPPK